MLKKITLEKTANKLNKTLKPMHNQFGLNVDRANNLLLVNLEPDKDMRYAEVLTIKVDKRQLTFSDHATAGKSLAALRNKSLGTRETKYIKSFAKKYKLNISDDLKATIIINSLGDMQKTLASYLNYFGDVRSLF